MTADASALSALLERVRGAEGPSRELDARLYALVRGWHDAYLSDDHYVWELVFREERDGKRVYDLGEREDEMEVPVYTDSIDEALALVEQKLPGWSWEVRRSGFGTPSQARLYNPMKSPGDWSEVRVDLNSTPALAILAALLTRLIAQLETGHG